MQKDRFINTDPAVRNLVLRFENHEGYFDVGEIESIANFYLDSKDVEGLGAVVKHGEKLFPGDDTVLLHKAYYLSMSGRHGEAKSILLKLEKQNPTDTDVCYALGVICSSCGQPEEAIYYYLRAVVDGNEPGVVFGNIADEYYNLGLNGQAERYYLMAIEKDANDERSLYNLACIWQQENRLEEGVGFYEKVVDEHPYSGSAWYCLGCVYRWLSLYEKAVDAYEYAVAIDNALTDAYLGLSECYRKLGDMGRAAQALRDALEHSDVEQRRYVRYLTGRIFLDDGNYHTAAAYLRDAVKEFPTDYLSWNDLGLCYEKLGDIDEAAECYRRAINLFPHADGLWMSLADLYINAGRFDDACGLLESARSEACDVFAFDSRLIYCLFKMGKRSRMLDLLLYDAVEHSNRFEELLRQFPDLADDTEVLQYINNLKR